MASISEQRHRIIGEGTKRMPRMLPELRGLSYPERLKALGVTALDTGRLDDLIEVFKIVKGFVNIDRKIFFQEALSNRRGHSEKLYA